LEKTNISSVGWRGNSEGEVVYIGDDKGLGDV